MPGRCRIRVAVPSRHLADGVQRGNATRWTGTNEREKRGKGEGRREKGGREGGREKGGREREEGRREGAREQGSKREKKEGGKVGGRKV